MDNRAKFYCWLIGKLGRRHMTIQEICDDWAESSSNIDGKELSVRTFHRISYLEIVCERQLLSKRTLELIIGQYNISHGYSCKR